METPYINLIVKVQQFEDKRIAAKASWNIKELKGKLSEIYPTSTEEQKLIYSGKLLNDTVVLKDVLREYEGQEAHTVHLVFTPKNLPPLNRIHIKEQQNLSPVHCQTNFEMSTNELRQRHTSASNTTNDESRQSTSIPNSYYNGFFQSTSTSGTPDLNNILAQQYAMQSWMQQAYAQYINQYVNIMSTSEAFQQHQQAQSMSNIALMHSHMPYISPTDATTSSFTSSSDASSQSPNSHVPQAPIPPQQQPQQQQGAVEPQQRRFPNIIQDEQENRDWLDILYSMSRLLILLCLVYFYSSPLRCCIVILIGVSIFLYHIYRQNQNRLNNNNTIRVNLNNVNRPEQQAPQGAAVPANNARRSSQDHQQNDNEGSELQSNSAESGNETEVLTQNNEPQVPIMEKNSRAVD